MNIILHLSITAEGDLAAFSHHHKTNHFKSQQPPPSTQIQVLSSLFLLFF